MVIHYIENMSHDSILVHNFLFAKYFQLSCFHTGYVFRLFLIFLIHNRDDDPDMSIMWL